VTDEGEHAVLVELVPYGEGRRFLAEMLQAYAEARGELDSVAWSARGEVGSAEGRAAVETALGRSPDHVVAKIVGLCIRDFLELETGTHVWQDEVREPELLRIRVLPAPPGLTPRAHVEAHLAARERAERGASDERLDRLLPVVRTIRFEPPPARRPAALLEMEDYVLGMPHTARVSRIADVFPPWWLLRVSRVTG
jgi:ATP-dependent Clp protease ATP-binding subunit ClpA/ATP-dependent Clp protease ATP-binding subunit ClpC